MSAETRTDKRATPTRPAGAPILPQVNLLPPEVRAARSLSAVKRWLAIGLGAVVILIALGYGVTVLEHMDAVSGQADAEERATQLSAQEEKYAEVVDVQNDTALVTQARIAATDQEVLWKSYLDAIVAVLPNDVSITSFALTGPDPMTTTGVTTPALGAAGIGGVAFESRSATIPDAAAWLDALNSVPGLSNSWVSTVDVGQDDESGQTYYSVSVTARLTSDALSHRFDPTEEAGQ